MTLLIAITGGSGAGKTTLARALAKRLSAAVIAEDDYYRCASTYPDFDAATHNFDAPDTKEHALLRAHLEAAKLGRAFEKPLYDLVTHRRRAETEAVAPTPALIVEGIHLLVPPDLRALFDLKVFIDADDALRLGRRMIRDVEARGRSPRSVLTQFFANVRPMHDAFIAPQRAHADVVLHSTFTDDPESAERDAERIAALVSRA
jgi:uridine kinase